MIRTILVLLFAALFLIIGIPFLGIFWLMAKNERHRHAAALAQLRMVQWAFRCISALSGVRLTVIGEENVPKDRAVLYIGNHRSYFDIILSYARCPELTGFVSKNGMEKIPLLAAWMRRLNCLFIDRDDIKQSMKTILAGIENVKSGISMCIYPEGTRGRGADETEMLPFHEGSLKIAKKAGCPIIPMAITGSADVFEAHIPFIRRTHVILEYGAPIDPAALSPEDQKKLGAYCQSVILEMLKKHQTMQV